jgi:UDP-2,4-diacetamido-2,4,6-trideoxy-beta-L-altropyranose hydrolase
MTLHIVFRTDASLKMGTGHVMRCLTLADVLKAKGAQCHFISRAHPGHLMEVIRLRGYVVSSLGAPIWQAQNAAGRFSKAVSGTEQNSLIEPIHSDWLGCTWQTDAHETAYVLGSLKPDWLVVDHYALDQRWELALCAHYRRLLVIDDLADRPHVCDMLLDQNLDRKSQDYAGLLPTHCKVLTGPEFALLRPEFAALRAYSLQRRQAQPAIRQLLISMGGVDEPNATGQVLKALKACKLPAESRITVVMGLKSIWLKNVQELAQQMPRPTSVMVNVNDMAKHMADSDLAIGAAGSTSWERCCLGLPTLMVVLADNQSGIAMALDRAGAAMTLALTNLEQLTEQLQDVIMHFQDNQDALRKLGLRAAKVTKGTGTKLVAANLFSKLT